MFYYRCDAMQGQSVWRFIANATTNGVQETNKITDLFHRTSGSNLTADTAIRTSTDVKDCDYVCVCVFFYSSRTNLRIFHILKSNHACYCSSATACLPCFFRFHLICLIFSAALPFITPLPFFSPVKV